MRRIQTIGIIIVLALAGPVRADDKEARQILDRAIKAHGGAAALTRAAQIKRTDRGTQVVLARQVPFTSEVIRSLPDKWRLTVETGGAKIIQVLNGNKGWSSDGGPAVALLEGAVNELRNEAYIAWLATLVPLTKPGYTLSSLPESKVSGEPAVGIKAVRKGDRDVRLYFLKRNGLLARIDVRTRVAGLEVDKEYQFSQYKEFDGVRLPTRHIELLNGKKFAEYTISDVTFPTKLDPKTFEKP
jgi:hypothetical protein